MHEPGPEPQVRFRCEPGPKGSQTGPWPVYARPMSGCADFICHHEINTGISLPLDVLTSGNQGESDEAVWCPFSCVFPLPTLTVFALPALAGFDNAAHLSSANILRHSLSSMPTHQHLPFFCFQPSLHILAYLGMWPLISLKNFFRTLLLGHHDLAPQTLHILESSGSWPPSLLSWYFSLPLKAGTTNLLGDGLMENSRTLIAAHLSHGCSSINN